MKESIHLVLSAPCIYQISYTILTLAKLHERLVMTIMSNTLTHFILQKPDKNLSVYHQVEFQSEMDALRVQLLEVYKEFEENCDNVKRKDIELLNKTKQIKLLTAEWKEAEQKLNNQLESLRNENQTLWAENGELRVELERSKSSVDDFVRKMRNAEEQLSYLYQKLSNLDRIFYDCKQKSLYR